MSVETLVQIAQIGLELDMRPQRRESIEQKAVRAAQIFGFPLYVIGVRGPSKTLGKDPLELKLHNLPAAFQERYDKEYHRVDPYVRKARTSLGQAFRWDEVQCDDKEQEYRTILAMEGMAHGITATFPTPEGFMGMVMFMGMAPSPVAEWQHNSLALTLFCGAVTRSGALLLRKSEAATAAAEVQNPLTEREVDCLELTAQGLTAAQIAAELHLSAETIYYHLESATKKLKVRNSREALAEALARGFIRKRYFGAPKFGTGET